MLFVNVGNSPVDSYVDTEKNLMLTYFSLIVLIDHYHIGS